MLLPIQSQNLNLYLVHFTRARLSRLTIPSGDLCTSSERGKNLEHNQLLSAVQIWRQCYSDLTKVKSKYL